MTDLTMLLTVVFASFIIKNVISGALKGSSIQIFRLIFLAISAVEAYFITSIAADKILGEMSAESVADAISSAGLGLSSVEKVAPYFTAWNWILQLPVAVIVSPALFATIFFALNTLNRVFCYVVRICFGVGKPEDEPLKNVFGALLGALEGFVIAVIMFLPFVAMTNVTKNSFEVVRAKDDGQYTSVVEFYDDNLAPFCEHNVVKLVNSCGGEKLLEHYATIELDGEKTNLIDESTTAVSICIEFSAFKGANYSALTEEHKAVFYDTIDELEESPYLSTVVSGILSGIGRAIQDSAFTVEAPAPFDEILDPVLDIFATSDRHNLHGDLNTILDVYFLLSDSGTLDAYGREGGEDEVKSSLIERDQNGNTLMSQVVDILEKNERTKPLVTTLTRMTITVLTGQIGDGEFNVEETYDKIKLEFHDVLAINPEDYTTTDEYEAARDDAVNTALLNNGIDLDDETVHGIGDYVDEHYGDHEDLTDEDINNILLHYYEVSANQKDADDKTEGE